MNKPVWRVNTGNGVPSDLLQSVIDPDSVVWNELSNETLRSLKLHSLTFWTYYFEVTPIVSAYETNRTKAAKYERVECDSCLGHGKHFSPVEGGSYSICPHCNGKGYTLERIK